MTTESSGERASTDTERLDWMQANAVSAWANLSDDAEEHEAWSVNGPATRAASGPTLREAIDAAMGQSGVRSSKSQPSSDRVSDTAGAVEVGERAPAPPDALWQCNCVAVNEHPAADLDCGRCGKKCPPSLYRRLPSAPAPSASVAFPSLPTQRALTVVMLPDTGGAQADACLAKIDDGGAFVVGPPEMFVRRLRRRAAETPALLDKVAVFYLVDGEYQPVGLGKGDELYWPVGFLQDSWAEEVALSHVRWAARPASEKKAAPAAPAP